MDKQYKLALMSNHSITHYTQPVVYIFPDAKKINYLIFAWFRLDIRDSIDTCFIK